MIIILTYYFCFSAGGLVTAVCPVVIKGNGLWVGWAGIHLDDPIDEIPESDPNDQTPTAGLKSEQVNFIIFISYNKKKNQTYFDLTGFKLNSIIRNVFHREFATINDNNVYYVDDHWARTLT